MDLLVAIQRDRTLRHIKLDRNATTTLSGTFEALTQSFAGPHVEVHDYEAGFRPDEDGVMAVPFDLPQSLKDCGKSKPSNLAVADPKLMQTSPPIALVAIHQGAMPRFTFQAVDNRNMLKAGGVLFFNPNGFSINEEAAITITNRVDAVHKGGKLYFKSEHNVRRFLDIDYLFREATDDELGTLFSQKIFSVDDLDDLKSVATSPLRRKLHAVLTSQREIKPRAVQDVAKRVGQTIAIRKGALVVPTGKAEFREFVRLLADDYLESPQDHDRLYLTTSKKRVKAK